MTNLEDMINASTSRGTEGKSPEPSGSAVSAVSIDGIGKDWGPEATVAGVVKSAIGEVLLSFGVFVVGAETRRQSDFVACKQGRNK